MNSLRDHLIRWVGRKLTFDEHLGYIKRFGSTYGGWSICTCRNHTPADGLIISAGAGEDISFDLEILEAFKSPILLIDPTERSKAHIESLFDQAPRDRIAPYSKSGCQSLESYRIPEEFSEFVKFENSALWVNSKGIQLLPPSNVQNVSYRLEKRSNKQSKGTHFPSIDLNNALLLFPAPLRKISLLKMDIEGSEDPVLIEMTSGSIRPKQIAVELDFLREKNSIQGIFQYLHLINRILRSGYKLIHVQGLNYTFVFEGLE